MVAANCLGVEIGFQEVEFGNLSIRVGLLDVGHDRQEFMKQVYQMGIELFSRQGVHFLESFIQGPGVFIAPFG